MKISLRKANALQASIVEAIKGLTFSGTIQISEFENAEEKIKSTRDEFMREVFRRNDLNETLYAIRKAVAEANASAGVNDKLNVVALLDRKIQNLTELSRLSVRESPEVLFGRLEKIRARKEESSRVYGYDNNVSSTVFSKEDINGFKANLAEAKKAKQKLQDELLELNVRTQIELADSNVAILQRENLI